MPFYLLLKKDFPYFEGMNALKSGVNLHILTSNFMNVHFFSQTKAMLFAFVLLALAFSGCKKYHPEKHAEQEAAYAKLMDAYKLNLSVQDLADADYEKWASENAQNASAKALREEVIRTMSEHKKKKTEAKATVENHAKMLTAHKEGKTPDAEVDKQFETMMAEMTAMEGTFKAMGEENIRLGEKRKNVKPAVPAKPNAKVTKKR
ncbi:MAG: hypothetical protein ACKVTZ_14250 [Bacteroidia bacterium]